MTTERSIIENPPGYASPRGALAVAELDTLTSYMWEDLAGIEADELGWQAAPGHNTIGMLLAHIAIVEVFWTQIGLLGREEDVLSVLGIDVMGDGLPIPASAPAFAPLAGHDLAWYRTLVDKAREYTKQHLRGMDDAALEAMRARTRKNGSRQEFSGRWVLFHLLEHLAGHYGQILLVRHLYRDRVGAATTGA